MRTIDENKAGFHYANTPYDEKTQIRKALESARAVQTRYQWDIGFPGPQSYPVVEGICDPAIENAEIDDVVEFCKVLRDGLSVYNISSRGVCYCRKTKFTLKTSNHLNVSEKSTFFELDMDFSMEDTTFNITKSTRLWDKDTDSFTDFVQERLSFLKRKKVRRPFQKIVLGSRALYAALRPLVWQLSIDRIKRGISHIKLDQQVASEHFSLVDDGCYPNGPGTSLCDGEGIPSGRHFLISNGHVKTLFYDYFSALLDNTKSTSNAVRTSIMAPPKIHPRTLVVSEGDLSLDEVTGVLIEEVVNDKGASLVTGDFVFNIKNAFYVKKGEVLGTVDPFVIKGNVIELLQQIYGVGTLQDTPFSQYRELITPYVFIQTPF